MHSRTPLAMHAFVACFRLFDKSVVANAEVGSGADAVFAAPWTMCNTSVFLEGVLDVTGLASAFVRAGAFTI